MTAQRQVRLANGTVLSTVSLLDAVLEATPVLVEVTNPVVIPTMEFDESGEVWADFQAIEWMSIEVPCPGCGVYPCRPGMMNGHRLIQNVPVAGPVTRIRVK